MAEGIIIASVGKGLLELLKATAGFAEGELVLKSPAEANQAAKVSLFLYHVQNNPYLRNQEPEAIREDAMRPPPLTLDLFYLVTPLAPEPETALGHLEAVMLALHDNPVLRAPTLTQDVVEAGNEAVRIVPHPLSLEDTNRLWAIFPGKPYRLSVAYLVSPVEVQSKKEIQVKRVVETVYGSRGRT